MGRTWRHRRKTKPKPSDPSLETDTDIIALKKWMKTNKWSNKTRLQLRNFSTTGRGIGSKRFIKPNDNLIEIPYDLMITLTVLEKSKMNIVEKLSMHEMLALFLSIEKCKGVESSWYYYIKTLPCDNPALPWMCSNEESILLGNYMDVKGRREKFLSSWCNVKKSIRDCVLNLHSFAWAYIMVNTRAVYVDPDTVSTDNSLRHLLSDDPSMALCPYLDMFNHSYNTNTEAKLLNGSYALRSLTGYGKYQQIFISYGAHDNCKLLMEYGFFIPFNKMDILAIQFEDLLKHNKINQRQYKYLKDKKFDEKLYVGLNGLSFNLKALLYVMLRDDIIDWNVVIYTEDYQTEDLSRMFRLVKNVIELKEIVLPVSHHACSIYMRNAIDYLNYTVIFREVLVKYLHDEMNKFVCN